MVATLRTLLPVLTVADATDAKESYESEYRYEVVALRESMLDTD